MGSRRELHNPGRPRSLRRQCSSRRSTSCPSGRREKGDRPGTARLPGPSPWPAIARRQLRTDPECRAECRAMDWLQVRTSVRTDLFVPPQCPGARVRRPRAPRLSWLWDGNGPRVARGTSPSGRSLLRDGRRGLGRSGRGRRPLVRGLPWRRLARPASRSRWLRAVGSPWLRATRSRAASAGSNGSAARPGRRSPPWMTAAASSSPSWLEDARRRGGATTTGWPSRRLGTRSR